MHGRSGCERNQGDEDVIAGIDLESGVGHWAGSLMAGCGNDLSLKGYRLETQSMEMLLGYDRGFVESVREE